MRGLNLTGFCAKLQGQNEAPLLKNPAGTAVGITGLCNSDLIKSKFEKKGGTQATVGEEVVGSDMIGNVKLRGFKCAQTHRLVCTESRLQRSAHFRFPPQVRSLK